MVSKLVSILTPCFNSTDFIGKLLESVVNQDYSYIEHILVDDGSTDNLFDFLVDGGWFQRYAERGFQLHYYYQKNQGQASAINKGLKHYKGSYVTWPDSDDYYATDNAISTFVKTMNVQSVDIVRCRPLFVNECGESIPLDFAFNMEDDYVFYDCLLETDFWFTPICYFFRTQPLRNILHNKILESRVGQNFQLYLPLFYFTNLYTIPGNLAVYLVRKKSHSHKLRDTKQAVQRLDDILNLKYKLLEKYNLNVNATIMKRLQMKKDAETIRILIGSQNFKQAIDYIINRASFPTHAVKAWLKSII